MVDYFARHGRAGKVSVRRPYLLILGGWRAWGGR
jgi:hypothetical protein